MQKKILEHGHAAKTGEQRELRLNKRRTQDTHI